MPGSPVATEGNDRRGPGGIAIRSFPLSSYMLFRKRRHFATTGA
jgi:hypothetical protein